VTDRDTENARKLVTGSRVFAANSREGFVAQYPTLGQVSVDDWERLLAIAGTGTALLMIPSRFESVEQKELTATVVTTLHEWNDDSVQYLADFLNFVTSRVENSAHIPDIIGTWTLQSVELQESETSAPHVLGLLLVNTFGPWWDQ